jgi:hypothetical protein
MLKITSEMHNQYGNYLLRDYIYSVNVKLEVSLAKTKPTSFQPWLGLGAANAQDHESYLVFP